MDIEKTLREFDEKIERSVYDGGWDIPYEGADDVKIRKFLQEKLQEAIQQERKRVLEGLEETFRFMWTDERNIEKSVGISDCHEIIVSLINSKIN